MNHYRKLAENKSRDLYEISNLCYWDLYVESRTVCLIGGLMLISTSYDIVCLRRISHEAM